MEVFDQLNKNLHKTRYYLRGYARRCVPRVYWAHKYRGLMKWYDSMLESERASIDTRVNYYCKLQRPFTLGQDAELIGNFAIKGNSIAYAIDYQQLLNYFPSHWKTQYRFGDITEIPALPCFLKSRPVTPGAENANSVLLKLNQIRHYYFVKDKIKFNNKLSQLVWRGKTTQAERQKFLEQFHANPWCDVGDTYKKTKGSQYHKPFMSIPEQLRYKYVLSIEGYDVATNTKWIMASNSLCFMRKPRFETWFMEGNLVAGEHYVLLRDDYSDVEEKIAFYEANPEAAQQIIRQANNYVAQFFDADRELLISLLVMRRYFNLSGQCSLE